MKCKAPKKYEAQWNVTMNFEGPIKLVFGPVRICFQYMFKHPQTLSVLSYRNRSDSEREVVKLFLKHKFSR